MRTVTAISVILFFIALNTVASESRTNVPSKTLDAIHSHNMSNLPAVIRESIRKQFPDDKVVGQCPGSFAHEGEFEYAIALFTPKENSVFYIAILRHDDVIESPIEIVKKSSNSEAALTEEVQCLSAMEVKRRNTLFSTMEGFEGQITSTTAFDIMCFFTESTHAACYAYDPSKQQFIRVGGWSH